MALGLYVIVGLPLAWLPSNQPRYGKRTTAIGLQLTIGNTSGIMAPFVSQIHSSVLPLLERNVTEGCNLALPKYRRTKIRQGPRGDLEYGFHGYPYIWIHVVDLR